MTDFWIVSSHEFMRHQTVDSALAEAARLTKLTSRPFHVYGVGEKIGPGTAPEGGAAAGTDPPHKVDPHAYVPSATHWGDCAVCGHLQGDPIHSPFLRSK